jgi:hypothetical protein
MYQFFRINLVSPLESRLIRHSTNLVPFSNLYANVRLLALFAERQACALGDKAKVINLARKRCKIACLVREATGLRPWRQG